MSQTYFPVVRRGRLVRADKAGKIQRALTQAESVRALELLAASAEQAVSNIKAAMVLAAKDHQFRLLDEWEAELAPAGRARGVGVVYNYHEFAIELDGAQIVVRCSVTLCVEPSPDLVERDGLPFSKFWTRFIMLTHPGGSGQNVPAINVTHDRLRVFNQDCDVLTAAAVGAIAGDYREVLREVTGDQDLVLNTQDNGEFVVLTLGADGGDVPDLFEAATGGHSLTSQAKTSRAAKSLFELAIPTLNNSTQGVGLDEALRAFQGDDYQFIIYESADDDQGLYLAKFEDKVARFVGLALHRGDPSRPTTYNDLAEVHHMPSNVVSAGLVTRYARQY